MALRNVMGPAAVELRSVVLPVTAAVSEKEVQRGRCGEARLLIRGIDDPSGTGIRQVAIGGKAGSKREESRVCDRWARVGVDAQCFEFWGKVWGWHGSVECGVRWRFEGWG